MARYPDPGSFDRAMRDLKDYWTGLLSGFQLASGSEKLDRIHDRAAPVPVLAIGAALWFQNYDFTGGRSDPVALSVPPAIYSSMVFRFPSLTAKESFSRRAI